LTVKAYAKGILKPAYRIIKSVDPQATVLSRERCHTPEFRRMSVIYG